LRRIPFAFEANPYTVVYREFHRIINPSNISSDVEVLRDQHTGHGADLLTKIINKRTNSQSLHNILQVLYTHLEL
jgi:hypothetical protein